VTWPLPELDAGVDDGELRPDDEELLLDDFGELELLLDDFGELELLLDDPELAELEPEPLDVPDVAWCVPVAVEAGEEWEAAEAAPGRLTATTPAATMLAAAADTVAARSRLRPRSRSAMPGGVPRGGMLCLLMTASLAARFRTTL
jgi:hypothetical protein